MRRNTLLSEVQKCIHFFNGSRKTYLTSPPHTLAQSLVGPLVELLTQRTMSPRNAPQGTTFKTFCLLWFLAGSGAFHVQPNARFSVVRDDSGILGSSRRGTLTTRKATEKSDHGGSNPFFAAHPPSTKSRHGFLGGLFSAGKCQQRVKVFPVDAFKRFLGPSTFAILNNLFF